LPGEGKGSGGAVERYFDVEGDDDFFESDVDFESDFLPLSLDDFDDESDLESDLPDELEDSDESFESLESLDSDEPSESRLTAVRLSVRWKPEPLNTMPTGWSTLESFPPHPGCFFSGSSENDCHSSISSPHFAHS
jgi:hypothetical protein